MKKTLKDRFINTYKVGNIFNMKLVGIIILLVRKRSNSIQAKFRFMTLL